MNTDDRTRLRRFISNHRDSWDDAGIEAALVKLDQQFPNEPLRVAMIAIHTAMNAAARTPAAMHKTRPPFEALTDVTTPGLPVIPYNPCPDHPKSGLRQNGQCAGCWVDQAEQDMQQPYYVRAGVRPQDEDRAAELRRLAFPQRFELARKQREDEGKAVTNG